VKLFNTKFIHIYGHWKSNDPLNKQHVFLLLKNFSA